MPILHFKKIGGKRVLRLESRLFAEVNINIINPSLNVPDLRKNVWGLLDLHGVGGLFQTVLI